MSSKLLTLFAAACLAFLTACAGSSSGPQQVASASNAAEDADAPESVRCRTILQTGSRIGTKVCKTNARWEEEQRASREAVEKIQRGGAQTQTHAGAGGA